MTSIDLIKMSSKGQLVVPQDIREQEDFESGDRFIAFPVKGGVFFKRIKIPDPEEEFRKLSEKMTAKFKKNRITQRDINEAVKWARKKS